jgi:hypothetical protein
MVTWETALMNGKVVSPTSFKAMTTSNGFVTNGSLYGFGLVLTTFNGHSVTGHSGGGGGFSSEEVVFLDSGSTLIVLTNDDHVSCQLVLSISNAVCSSVQLSYPPPAEKCSSHRRRQVFQKASSKPLRKRFNSASRAKNWMRVPESNDFGTLILTSEQWSSVPEWT